MTRTIEVLGAPQEVNVQRTYRSVWIAAGDYMGRRIEVKERSEDRAMTAWLEAAKASIP